MQTPIEAEIAGILARIGRIAPEGLTRDADLAGLGLQSIQMVEAIFAIEEHFDISVPYGSAPGSLTFGALVDQVAGLVEARI